MIKKVCKVNYTLWAKFFHATPGWFPKICCVLNLSKSKETVQVLWILLERAWIWGANTVNPKEPLFNQP
jgi:hypothetical protein